MIVALALIFLAINVIIGVRLVKWVRSGTDFLVAGREVRGLIQFCSFSAVNFAGSVLVAVPAFVITVGFWPAVWWNASNGIWYIIIAFTTLRFLRRSGVYTISEWVEMRFGRGARQAIALGQFIGLIFGGAANLAGVGLAMGPLLGWDYATTNLITTLAFVSYMLIAGAWGNTVNDTFQFVFGMFLYFVVIGFALIAFGLPTNNYDPTRVFAIPGGAPVLGLGGPPIWMYGIFGWFFFSFTAQHYYVKAASVRTDKQVMWGTAAAGVYAIMWSFLLALIGLYALHVTPGGIAPERALGAFASFTAQLPPIMAALLVVSYLSAALSTITAVLQANASIAARDFYQGLLKPDASSREMLLPARVATLLTAALMFVAAFIPGGPAPLLALMGAFLGVTAILFVIGVFWRRATPNAAAIGAFAGIATGLLWAFVLPPSITAFPGSPVFAGYPAATVALVLTVGLSFVTEPKYYGRPDWKFGRERLMAAKPAIAAAE